ncbi:copper homeostasis CutC domain-containing protein [Mycena pura]|uniref:Copper homeostasis protein cutC homolog n=1 Tax=Mycena pura TaxID=153505 RepID=A0AAD6UV38_9AGAR|nr:copper homeostasis CutC domain-containing protein [Mycena pura]
MPKPIIEVCVDSVQSAFKQPSSAVRGGADRLEVCANLGVGGGTTPSLGLLKAIQKSVDVPLMAMVRPRTGDFLYNSCEIEVMLEDIRVFKQHNVCGVVLGTLTADGRVDVEVAKRLVDEALPLQVCFHRAFDMTRDPAEGKSLRDVMKIGGVTRLLTSGHGRTAFESLDMLKSLCQTTRKCSEEGVLSILPGSGINSDTARIVGPILEALYPLGITELHLSGASWVEGVMVHRRSGLEMGVGASEWSVWVTSEAKVRDVRRLVDAAW